MYPCLEGSFLFSGQIFRRMISRLFIRASLGEQRVNRAKTKQVRIKSHDVTICRTKDSVMVVTGHEQCCETKVIYPDLVIMC